MNPKVVSLHGNPVWQGDPCESVIKLLEEALEQAKSAEICGVILVRQYRDAAVSQDRRGYTRLYPCVGGLEEAKADLLKSG